MPRLKRFDTKKLLENPDLRRRLIVDATVATQAREGIEVSQDEAENSYYVVSEGERAAFFGLVPFRTEVGENDGRHVEFVKSVSQAENPCRIDVSLSDFHSIENSPLAYSVLSLVGPIFRSHPPLQPSVGIARQGKATGDDPKWLRYFWETTDSDWVPYAKGGEYSRFYKDVDMRIDWNPNRRSALKSSGNGLPSEEHYFSPGLTWPRRTNKGLSMRRLPSGCIFGDKSPVVFLNDPTQDDFILGLVNSELFEFLFKAKTSYSWEVGIMKSMPIPDSSNAENGALARAAHECFDLKSTWDTGNEICTRFDRPWVLQPDVNGDATTLSAALDAVLNHEAALDAELQATYTELNDAVYRLYGVNDKLKAKLEAAIGQRPPEIVWPQMEGKDRDQKRREHVDRLLLYLVRRVVEADADGLVCFEAVAHEPPLLDRLRHELHAAFPAQDPAALETEVINELKKKTKGYRRAESLAEWLQDVFFESHSRLYQQRPLIWHLASDQVRRVPAFGALVHAHKFDADALAKLRGTHLRDRLAILRREAGQAAKDGREDDRLEALAAVEEAEAYDEKLKRLQEGFHSPFGLAAQDYRILTPWKSPAERPKGWHPDLDDGIKVNIDPLGRTGLLRIKWRSVAVEED